MSEEIQTRENPRSNAYALNVLRTLIFESVTTSDMCMSHELYSNNAYASMRIWMSHELLHLNEPWIHESHEAKYVNSHELHIRQYSHTNEYASMSAYEWVTNSVMWMSHELYPSNGYASMSTYEWVTNSYIWMSHEYIWFTNSRHVNIHKPMSTQVLAHMSKSRTLTVEWATNT